MLRSSATADRSQAAAAVFAAAWAVLSLAVPSSAFAASEVGEKVPDAVGAKDAYLAERTEYHRRLSELVGAAADREASTSPRGQPYLVHVGLAENLAPSLQEIEIRFDNGERHARPMATSDFARSRARWVSFTLASLPRGTRLYRVRLRYRAPSGATWERFGAATLRASIPDADPDRVKVNTAAESFLSLRPDPRDAQGLEIAAIEFDKPFSEAPPAAGITDAPPPVAPAPEFLFFRPRRPSAARPDRRRKVEPFAAKVTAGSDSELRALIAAKRYGLALAYLNTRLASLETRSFADQVRLRLVRALLEASTDKLESARRSVRHAEELFWARTATKTESWDTPTSRLYFSIGLLKKDLEALAPL